MKMIVKRLWIYPLLLVGLMLPYSVFAEKDDHGHEHGPENGSEAKDEHGHEHGDEAKGHDEKEHEEKGHDEEKEDGHEHGHESKPTEFTDEILKQSGISIEKPSAQKIKSALRLSGRVIADEDRVVHVIPRYAGIIRDVRKKLGDKVEKGDVLVIIESNQSLQPYEVKSLISGVVVKRHASVGEFVAEEANIFIVADLSKVIVDMFVFEPDFKQVGVGQKIEIEVPHLDEVHSSIVSFVSSVVDESTQSKFVRGELDNSDGHFYPGQFVTGDLITKEVEVPLAVRASALQRIEGEEVVFVKHGEHFEPEKVVIGMRDREWVEITKGLRPNDLYAVGNSFIIKAELGKSEAEHEH